VCAPTAARAAGPACDVPGTTIVAEAGGSLAGIDPVSGAIVGLPDPDSPVGRGWITRLIGQPPGPPRWSVVRTADGAGTHVVVTDVVTGAVVLDERFGRRIELAASAVSPDGRFIVYVQGNNLATEVTILDAVQASVRLVRIAHDADLAPFAIGIVFNPAGACAALSMERIGGPGPETWLVDLDDGTVSRLDAFGAFVVDWLPFQVD
jgi:hypothetical protein